MAVYKVTGPDGQLYNVTAPDDATPDAVMRYAKSMSPPAAATDDYSDLDAAMIGAGKTATRIGQGMQQLYYGATGNDQAAAALKAQVADENQRYAPLQAAHPLSTGLGEVLPSLAIPISGAATVPGAMLRSAAAMAAPAALEYGSPQDRAAAGAAGAIGGAMGAGAGALAGRVLQPIRGAGQQAVDATSALFDKYGISGLPGQITGSAPVRWLESTLANLPGGGRIRDMVDRQQSGLNSAVMGALGSTENAVTPESIAAAKSGIGQTFQNIPGKTTVAIDQPIAQKLIDTETNYNKNLSPDQRAIVSSYVNDILAYGENGMPGDVYQKARSRIAARASSTQDSELKTALTEIRKTLDGAFMASASGEDNAAMAAARQQWQTAKTVEPLANVTGNISPAKLANRASDLPASSADLAQLAVRMKGLPDSGTAQRLFYQSLLSGIPAGVAGFSTGDPSQAAKYGAASFAAPWLAAQALTRAPIKQYFTRGLLNVSPQLQDLLMRGGGALGGSVLQ